MPYAYSLRSCFDRDYPRSRVTDLIVATPVFLDLTFVGLESLPALGEERFAGSLLRHRPLTRNNGTLAGLCIDGSSKLMASNNSTARSGDKCWPVL